MALAAFAFGANLFAHTVSYDIANLVEPPGWKSTEAPGVLQIEDRRTVQLGPLETADPLSFGLSSGCICV
jgi:hypothetical protein